MGHMTEMSQRKRQPRRHARGQLYALCIFTDEKGQSCTSGTDCCMQQPRTKSPFRLRRSFMQFLVCWRDHLTHSIQRFEKRDSSLIYPNKTVRRKVFENEEKLTMCV